MKENKLEVVSIEQNKFEVIITESLYKKIKYIMSSKMEKIKLKNIIKFETNGISEYDDSEYDDDDDFYDDIFKLYIPYSSLDIEKNKSYYEEIDKINLKNYNWIFGVKKQKLYDYISSHSMFDVGGYSVKNVIKNVDEYIYTFYIKGSEEYLLEYKYFEEIILLLTEFIKKEFSNMSQDEDMNELIEYLNLLINSTKTKRNDNKKDVVFEINCMSYKHLLNTIKTCEHYLEPKIQVLELDYLSIEYIDGECIDIEIKNDKVIIKGSKYNNLDEYGEIDSCCDNPCEYFKLNDNEIKKILNHIKHIFRIEDFGSAAECIIDNMLKLVE